MTEPLPPKNPSRIRRLLVWLSEPLAVLLLVLCTTTAIAQPFYVPSGSMEPTLQIGDALLGSKFAYGYSRYSLPLALGPQSQARFLGQRPRRGDVVVFRLPRDPGVTYVKRLIGLPGDRIQMVEGRLIINRQPVATVAAGTGQVENEDGSFSPVARYTETLPGGVRHTIFKMRDDGMFNNTPVYVVPAGQYFMMGDNRDNSLDSRIPANLGGVGFVPFENLTARADIMLGSYDYLNMHSLMSLPGLVRLERFLRGVT